MNGILTVMLSSSKLFIRGLIFKEGLGDDDRTKLEVDKVKVEVVTGANVGCAVNDIHSCLALLFVFPGRFHTFQHLLFLRLDLLSRLLVFL